ncbi:MAG: hypothetical protein JWP58_4283 [Hymenobacter sp.]|nr:hypothetical protein [Hymenobacter sp.]
MKNYFASFLLLLSAVAGLSSCRESSKLPEPKNESVPLIIPEINADKSFFPFRRGQLSEQIRIDSFSLKPQYYTRPVFEFVINPSQGYAELQTVEVYKSFRRGAAYGPRVKIGDITSFPATVSLTSQEALKDLFPNAVPGTLAVLANPAVPTLNNRIVRNDAIVFTFEYVLKDGRRIVLTPVSPTDNTLLASSQINAPLAAVAIFK